MNCALEYFASEWTWISSQQNNGFHDFFNVPHGRGLSNGSFTAGTQEKPLKLLTRPQAIIFMTGSSMELIGRDSRDIPFSINCIMRAQARPVCTAKEVSGPGGVSAGILAVAGYRCNGKRFGHVGISKNFNDRHGS